MVDLSTTYMGLELKSPLIVGSSGLTAKVENIVDFARRGAGAVVLKSLFEEQIHQEAALTANSIDSTGYYTEAEDYIRTYNKDYQLSSYLTLIREAKAAVDIPIIASINCVSATEWTFFATQIEEAGADALELNLFVLPSDPEMDTQQYENIYFNVVEEVKKRVRIPVAIKLSHYFSSLAKTLIKLSWTGVKGMVLFNRFFSPDIKLNTLQVVPSRVFSSPEELDLPLRWISILSQRLHCDVCASTGVHDGEGLVKMLLVGSNAVQISSTVYKNGHGRIDEMLQFLREWMEENEYETVEAFRGSMSVKKNANPAAYERVQFMKYYAGIE